MSIFQYTRENYKKSIKDHCFSRLTMPILAFMLERISSVASFSLPSSFLLRINFYFCLIFSPNFSASIRSIRYFSLAEFSQEFTISSIFFLRKSQQNQWEWFLRRTRDCLVYDFREGLESIFYLVSLAFTLYDRLSFLAIQRQLMPISLCYMALATFYRFYSDILLWTSFLLAQSIFGRYFLSYMLKSYCLVCIYSILFFLAYSWFFNYSYSFSKAFASRYVLYGASYFHSGSVFFSLDFYRLFWRYCFSCYLMASISNCFLKSLSYFNLFFFYQRQGIRICDLYFYYIFSYNLGFLCCFSYLDYNYSSFQCVYLRFVMLYCILLRFSSLAFAYCASLSLFSFSSYSFSLFSSSSCSSSSLFCRSSFSCIISLTLLSCYSLVSISLNSTAGQFSFLLF